MKYHIKWNNITSRDVRGPQILGLIGVAMLLIAPAWSQSLLNLDFGQARGAAPAKATYAPAEPPAASVPGTLYVPPAYERKLNETDEAFIARMKVQQDVVNRQQAEALAAHRSAMEALVRDAVPRMRTADDDARLAAYEAKVEALRGESAMLSKRVHATAAAGVTVDRAEMMSPPAALAQRP